MLLSYRHLNDEAPRIPETSNEKHPETYQQDPQKPSTWKPQMKKKDTKETEAPSSSQLPTATELPRISPRPAYPLHNPYERRGLPCPALDVALQQPNEQRDGAGHPESTDGGAGLAADVYVAMGEVVEDGQGL